MKKVEKIQYEAFDGKCFDTERACREYEDENIHFRLAGLTADQIIGALLYNDPDLSDAFEYAGRLCEEKRKAAGVFKRRRNGDAEPAQQPEAA